MGRNRQRVYQRQGVILRLCRHLIMIIDTVLLEIKWLEIDEKHLTRFTTKNKSDSRWQVVFNGNKEANGYYPYITITKIMGLNGWHIDRIEIQFSAPMIIWGTNYYGIDETEKMRLFEILFEKLKWIFNGQPIITKGHLYTADLRVIAISFNFILPDLIGYPIEFLRVIPLLDMGKRFRKSKTTSYDQDTFGFCVRLFNLQSSLKIYDKGAQTINTATTPEEKEVVVLMKRGVLPSKVCRIELTFQNRTSLKKRLATKFNSPIKERNLYEVFDNKLCKNILLEAFDELFDPLNVQALDFPLFSPQESYQIAKEAGLSQYDAWALIGRSAIATQGGSLQLKLVSDKYYDRRDRFKNDKRLKKILEANPLPSFRLKKFVEECRKQLVEFKVMKPEHFIKNDLANFNKVV